jgi:hypothetical protein
MCRSLAAVGPVRPAAGVVRGPGQHEASLSGRHHESEQADEARALAATAFALIDPAKARVSMMGWGTWAAVTAAGLAPIWKPALPAGALHSGASFPPSSGGLGGPRPRGRVPVKAPIRRNRLQLRWPSHNKALKLTRLVGGNCGVAGPPRCARMSWPLPGSPSSLAPTLGVLRSLPV